MTINEELSKFTHEVEEVFQEVKQHMIVSVRDFSIQIAFVLMGITTAILVIGTVYVRCFHHPKHAHEHDEPEGKVETEMADHKEEEVAEKSSDKESEKREQNGHVRKRTNSSSASVNNNNSPVKSKIPVRQKSVSKSP